MLIPTKTAIRLLRQNKTLKPQANPRVRQALDKLRKNKWSLTQNNPALSKIESLRHKIIKGKLKTQR